MAKIVWDKAGEHFYETGVDRCVLYLFKNGECQPGVAWNGLISVNENPSGVETVAQYAANAKYLNLVSVDAFKASIEAFTYPDEFLSCDGFYSVAKGSMVGQQNRQLFGISYRTLKGNDAQGIERGYLIHLIYGCFATPSERDYSGVNESSEAMVFNWNISTIPVEVPGYKPTASLVLDSTKIRRDTLDLIEDILYGNDNEDPYLLTPEEVFDILTFKFYKNLFEEVSSKASSASFDTETRQFQLLSNGGKVLSEFTIPGGGGSDVNFGHGLKKIGDTVSVNTVDDFSGDNTLPITAAGVQATVGNIEALLSAI